MKTCECDKPDDQYCTVNNAWFCGNCGRYFRPQKSEYHYGMRCNGQCESDRLDSLRKAET